MREFQNKEFQEILKDVCDDTDDISSYYGFIKEYPNIVTCIDIALEIFKTKSNKEYLNQFISNMNKGIE